MNVFKISNLQNHGVRCGVFGSSSTVAYRMLCPGAGCMVGGRKNNLIPYCSCRLPDFKIGANNKKCQGVKKPWYLTD